MEPILIYGVPHGCSFGSIVAFAWSGLPYRLARVDMLSELEDAVFTRANPLRLTPALLLPNGEVLTESFAILQHVASKAPEGKLAFAPGSPQQDRLNEMLAFLVTGFHGAWGPLFSPFKYVDGDEAQKSVHAKARARAARGYAHIEALLADRDWLVGGKPTIADAYFAGVARWGADLQVFDLAAEYPRVHALLQRLEADPAVGFAHDAEEGRPLGEGGGGFLGQVSLSELGGRLAA
ncbi:glutathione S-transferase family protein [Caulobacter mirabilis]|uniref:Glutathione S-transferase n=1 Tax=Caulobacter mirabilis TaxID=69666 RepID=A0A2D2AXG9_9CAUL|nr:glutathione S-transferase family protein [Caulobacter mirabilis]ATQ42665.1 glutathione S-transferase [Caulobacter mirabilis]